MTTEPPSNNSPFPTGRLLIAGTGTGVGKTFVASRLIASAPLTVCFGVKPIESGFYLPESDAAKLSENGPGPFVPLYALSNPVSPHLAARREGRRIELVEAARWVHDHELAHPNRLCIVETAGGLFTPLAERDSPPSLPLTNLDLILALRPCRWILVAPDRLGVLNDVLAAKQASWSSLGAPDAILLSAPDGPNNLNTLAELRRFCSEPVIDVAPAESLFSRLCSQLQH
ncbi:MAG: hypothetical protein RJA70_40 [Pseudomonadota bacterium]|jgi:dethiobiotin synthase